MDNNQSTQTLYQDAQIIYQQAIDNGLTPQQALEQVNLFLVNQGGSTTQLSEIINSISQWVQSEIDQQQNNNTPFNLDFVNPPLIKTPILEDVEYTLRQAETSSNTPQENQPNSPPEEDLQNRLFHLSPTVDSTAPTLFNSSPVDNQTAVAINSNLVLTFNEDVQAGSGNIIISDGAGDIRTIGINDPQISFNGNTITINPIADLNPDSSYNIQLANGVVTDLAGNAFAGISDTVSLDFDTVDTQAPTLTNSNPSDNSSIPVDSNLTLTFNENVQAGSGNIIISDGANDIRIIDINDAQISFNGNTVTINPSADLNPNSAYNIQLANGVITDLVGNAFAGINDAVTLNFDAIDIQAPTLINNTPIDNSTAIALGSNLTLTFNENVQAGTGNIIISDGAGDTRVIDINDAQISFNGNTVTINPVADLNSASSYTVQLASGVITDLSGNAFAGINDAVSFNFETADTQAPTLTSSNPADNTSIIADSNLILTFNEAVQVGIGNIIISNGAGDTRTIDINDPQISFNGNTVTINLITDLTPRSNYNIQLVNGVITDLSGNAFAGINDAVTLNFDVLDIQAPILTNNTPIDNSTAIALDSNLTLTFNEDVQAGVGNLIISDGASDTRTIDINDAQISFNANTITINPIADLNPNSSYTVQLANGVITDLSGNAFAGINDAVTFNFDTVDTLIPTLSSSNPADNANNVNSNSNLSLTFNEAVQAGNGNIIISDGVNDTRTIDINDSQISFNGSTVTINPTNSLNPDTTYNIQLNSGVITDLAGNDFAGINNDTTLNFTIADTVAPTLNASSPSDNDTAVPINTNITLQFDEEVQAGTGSILISTNNGTRSIDINDPQVSFNGSTVTINPDIDFAANDEIKVQINNDVITDLAGNNVAGQDRFILLDFTTSNQQGLALSSSTPLDNSTVIALNSNLTLTFNENVQAGTGNIIISDGAGDTRTIDINGPQISFNGNTVTINPTADLNSASSYNIQLANGVITDLSGNAFAGINDAITLNFDTADTQAPTLTSSNPADNASIIANSNLILTFNEDVQAGSGNIIISDGANDTRTIAINDPQISIVGNTVTINPIADLNPRSTYNIQLANGVITDLSGNAFAGINDAVTLNFDILDIQAPTLTSNTPIDNSTAVALNSNLTLTFNEDVQAGAGNIIISDGADDTRTIAINDAQISVNGNIVTINPTADLNPNSSYTIQLATGVITDLSGNAFAGINDAVTFNFDTLDTLAPVLSSSNPVDNAINVNNNSNLSLTFNEAVQAGSGNIVISDGANDTRTIDINDSQISFSGSTVTINPTNSLNPDTTYNIQLNSGVITDLAGNDFTGINNDSTLDFTIADTVAPVLTASSPSDNDTAAPINTNITFQFDEDVQAGTGSILISTNNGVRRIDINDPQVSFNGSTVTINPDMDFAANDEVKVQINNDVITDLAGNNVAGQDRFILLDFSTSDQQALTLSSSNPLDNTTEVAIDTNIALDFNENVQAGAGNILISDGANDIRTIDINDAQISFNGNTVTINLAIDLNPNNSYNIQIDNGAITDGNGNTFAGINNASTLNFGTTTLLDTTAPTLSSSLPTDNGSAFTVGGNLTLTFNENVQAGTGNIIISDGANDTRTIDINDPQIIFNGVTLNINPTANLNPDSSYNIQLASGVITDLVGNAFAGINDAVSLNFDTTDTQAPTLASSTPADNSTAVTVASNLTLTFNENVQSGTGNIVISDGANDIRTIDINDAQISFNGTTVTINPTANLNPDSSYNIQLASGVITDLEGNAFTGINDAVTLNFDTTDTQAPTLASSTPADNSTAVAVASNLTLTFNENVQAGTGNIIISDGTNDTRTIDINDPQISFNGTTVTINPTPNLNPDSSYNIQLGSGVITDLEGNAFAGITDAITLNFDSTDTQAPTLASSTPADNTTAVTIGSNLTLTFNEDVQAGTGNIIISDGANDTRTIDINDPQISFNGTTVTINPTANLNPDSSYNIQLSSGVITDLEGNAFAGINDALSLNFNTTDTQAPTLASSTPADNATAVVVGSNLTLTFNENVQAGTGNIIISDGANDTRTIDINDPQISFNGTTVTINPTANLNPDSSYNIQLASGVITDLAGNAFAGINDAVTLNFNTTDTQAPTLASSTPTDNSTAVTVGSNLTLTFNENVQAGTGNIIISDGTNDTRTIDINDAQISISGNTVTINPTANLNPDSSYNIQFASGVITDLAGNAFAGINDAITLNFDSTDTQAPTLTSSTPADNTTAVTIGSNLTLTFNENVQAGTGNIIISDGANDTRTININDAQISINGNTVTINPTADLNPDSSYNIQLANGVISDLEGNAFAGITDAITLNFDSTDTQTPTLTSSIPADNTTAVTIGSNLTLTFNEDVQAGTGNIIISDGANDTRTIDINDPQISFNGNTVAINPTADLIPDSSYNIQLASGVITDLEGNGFAGITDTFTLNFSTGLPAVELSNIENGNGGFVINGISSGDTSGISVSNAGDVNGDGLSDLIVGASADDPNGSSSGASFVVFGQTNSTKIELSNIENGNNGFVINGVSVGDRSGRAVSNAGDVNGDGLADLFVGAYRDDPNGESGASFVIFGKTDGSVVELSSVEQGIGGFVINGVSDGDRSGFSVNNAGDVNGDGLDDLIIGAPNDDPNGAVSGASFVVFGKTDSSVVELSSVEQGIGGFVINGASDGDSSGRSVSNAGDVNGDGLADLVIGANINGSAGGAAVIFGKTDSTIIELSNIENGTGGFVINGISANDQSGYSVSNAGDVNGDGLADLIIGARYDDPNGYQSGASFVVFGKTNSTTVELSNIENGMGGFVINGVSASDQSGLSVSNAGDVNGDGLGDLIVGSLADPNGSSSGASFVVFGKTDGTTVELSNIENGINGFVINGVNTSDQSGRSVSNAGDVNGDGFSDLIVGANLDDPNGTDSGASFVIFGGQGSSAMVGTNNNDTLTGDTNANQLVAGAGNDLLLGNGGADVLRGGAGNDILAISDLNFASLDGGTGTDILRFDATLTADFGTIANSRLNSLEIIDLNNTGSSLSLNTDDILIIVGDEAANVLRINGGNTDTLDLSQTRFQLTGSTTIIDSITYNIYNPAANLNLDSSVQLLVEQNVTVVNIAPVELSDIENGNGGFVINGVSANDQSGYFISNAGDVNGDGLADLIIGAPYDDPNNYGGDGPGDGGASFVVFGKTDGTTIELSNIENGNGGFVINGVSVGDQSGRSVSSAGDVNGDGLADLIVGASGDDPNGLSSGASFVVFGQSNGTTVELSNIENGIGGFMINGVSSYDRSGFSVSNAGDVNGDGLADLIVGARNDDPNAGNSGASFVVFGQTNGTTVELSNIENGSGGFVINGVSTNDASGFSVSNAGDINGDGLADLIVGAYNDDPNGNRSGASFVVFGKTDGTTIELSSIENGIGGFVINGVSADDQSGRFVSNAGDVNGDGLADLIVGVRFDDPNGLSSGASFVVFGKTDGTKIELSSIENGVGGFVINGVRAGDQSGVSVSNAGDVNGDGFDDLLVGAYGDDPNGGSSGASFVVFGKTDGTTVELSNIENGIGGFVINGVSFGDGSGYSVSNAGDVNGDGFDDLLVGANLDDPNGMNSGASFVIFGGQGNSATVGTINNDILTGDANANQLVAGAGDDLLLGNGGADVLRGGAGNDILAISDLNFASLDGGTGTDTLRFDTALSADFGTIANSRLNSLEIIDLNNTGSSLTLNTADILTIVGDEAANVLRINGKNVDNLDLSQTQFQLTGLTTTLAGITYNNYTPSANSNLDSSVLLLVEQGVIVSGATVAPVELSNIDNGFGGFVINGVSLNDESGVSVSNAGDVNGDGLDDLIVGAFYDDPNGNSNSGASFVVFGKTDGTTVELSNIENGNGGFVINGVSINDESGFSVSNVGDVNGDGLADLLVGAYKDDPNAGYGGNSGASFVVFGKSDGSVVELSSIEQGIGGFVINGVSDGDNSGYSVSNAGDVNGDGLDDLIIGAMGDDPNGYNSGASFVVFGKTDGSAVELSTIEQGIGGFVINGISNSSSGQSVSNAGDVNGDGLADLLVGAPNADPNQQNNSGSSFVIFGKTDGTSVELTTIENGNGGFVINGVSANDQSGYSVSNAGDVNGDGLSDLIVAAVGDDPNGSLSGASFVVFGKSDGSVVELSSIEQGNGGFVINGVSDASADFSGLSVSNAGDINGDGLADLLVGSYYDNPNGYSSGSSFVVFGKTDGSVVELSTVEQGIGGFVINGVSAYDQSGYSVSTAGDVNGDGFDDLLVGANLDDPNGMNSGAGFVIFGGQGNSATIGTNGADTLTGDANTNQLVAGAGNDILLGNGGADVLRGGAGNDILAISDLNFASLDGGTGTDTLRFDTALSVDFGTIANTRLTSLEIIDLNNTGSSLTLNTADILTIVGDEAANVLRINGKNSDSLDLSQTPFQLTGLTTTLDGITYTNYTPAANSNLDSSVLLLVEQGVIVSGATIAPVELSNIENGNGGFVINGVSTGDQSGSSVSNAGDVNGDGLDDLIIGALGDDPNGNNSGASFVVFGKTNGSVLELSSIEQGVGGFVINGTSNSSSGRSVSGAGDINGDGLADFIVGAPFADPNQQNSSGASFVIFGKTDGSVVELSTIGQANDGFVINGVSNYDNSGFSVSNAGDINGDGLDDLIIGAFRDDPNGYNSGASFVVFGKTDGSTVELLSIEQSQIGGFVINGISNSSSGRSVSNAGDVNGDGLADLIIGAPYADPSQKTDSGASFVIFGKTDGTTVELSNIANGNGGFVINGVSALDRSGYSVSNAGDVNGDGLSDLIVAAVGDDPNGSLSGASFVVFGKSDGSVVELSSIEQGNGGFVINGLSDASADSSGLSVSNAGDINGDGLADLLLGSYYDNPNGYNSGSSFVVFGKTDGSVVELSTIEQGIGGFVINGVSAFDRSGNSVSGAGDINGDGFDDLLVGAYYDDPNANSGSGASFVIFGGQGNSATVGTNNNETLTGDANGNQLVAGAGDDILLGNGGADVLRGGAGNDILAISDLNFVSLDGGSGTDTLRFDSALALDLRATPDSGSLDSIEVIDLTAGGGNSTLSFNLTDVLNLNETQTSTNSLTILGNIGDTVNLFDSSNGQSGFWSESGSGTGVFEFAAGNDILATVTIDTDLAVNIFVAAQQA